MLFRSIMKELSTETPFGQSGRSWGAFIQGQLMVGTHDLYAQADQNTGHYLSDVLVGSALGYGIGKYVYHAHHRKTSDAAGEDEGPTASRWPAISPGFNRRARQYGVALTWSF